MKLWIDDVQPAPEGYFWARSVNTAKEYIFANDIELLDIDHDAGDYAKYGGDYIKLLDWLVEHGLSYPIRIHTKDIDAIAKIREIIKRNGWIEVRMIDAVELKNISHCPLAMCKKALEYAQEHNGDDYMAIAYLKAKTLAVATPNLSFDERVLRFMGEKKE